MNPTDTATIEVHLINLTRDGVDSWICDVEIGSSRVGPVYLHGKTEEEAVECARQSFKIVRR
jgi:hypothetical protein